MVFLGPLQASNGFPASLFQSFHCNHGDFLLSTAFDAQCFSLNLGHSNHFNHSPQYLGNNHYILVIFNSFSGHRAKKKIAGWINDIKQNHG